MTDTTSELEILNDLYLKILGRSVDPDGIKAYSHMVRDRIHVIEKQLKSSTEYKGRFNKQANGLNTMAGDRISYINSSDVSLLNNSNYSSLFDDIITMMITSAGSLVSKETVKLSVIDCIKNNRTITVFPHKEYYFNSYNFIEQLKDFNNFQYYCLFVCLSWLIKDIQGKTVATCGTKDQINNLIGKKYSNFYDLFEDIQQFILSYLGVRLCGRLLDNKEAKKLTAYIKQKNSEKLITFLQETSKEITEKENNTAATNLRSMSKPKVLVHIAYLENQNAHTTHKMLEHAYNLQQHNPLIDIDLYFENDRVNKEPTDYTPWSRVKRIRNIMLERTNLDSYDFLYVIDSDVVWYPYNFVSRAIGLNPTGITAPVMLIENSNVFYDWCGYQQKNRTSIDSKYSKYIMDKGCLLRNLSLQPPYIDDSSRLVEVDCVGCTYVTPTSVFKNGYGALQQELLKVFDLAQVNNHKILENKVQYEDHPTFTDHYTVCAATRSQQGKILMDRGSVAYHADLPIYGEAWH